MNKKIKIDLPSFLGASELVKKSSSARSFRDDCSFACQTGLCGECMTSRQCSPQGAAAGGTVYPPNISGVDPDKVTSGTVVIEKEDGETEVIEDCPKYEGAFYDPVTGEILGDTHGPDGKYDKEDWDKDYDSSTNTGHFTEKPKPDKKPSGGGGGGGGHYYPSYDKPSKPKPPPPPPKIEWNEPFPVFTGELKKIYRYVYHLGIDEAQFSNVLHDENSVCITPSIETGFMGEDNYIALEAQFKGNVEFYILDGTSEVPIMPIDQIEIQDEKIFFGLPTRFLVNGKADIIVKKNGAVVDLNYKDVISKRFLWNDNDQYSISYIPVPQYHYKPNLNTIQIKAILRGVSSIQNITIRRYGDTYYNDLS